MTLTYANIDYVQVAAKLSASLGRKWGVRVLFGGHPSTDGQTITLPHWPMDDPKMRGALYGLIAHEAGGHVRRTDFTKLAVHARVIRWPFPIWKSFENILEDIRIEANLLREYPGVRLYLDMIIEVMFETKAPASEAPETIDYWSTVQNWCLLVFRHDFLGQRDLGPKRDEIDALAGRLLGRSVLDEAYAIGRAASDLAGARSDFAALLELADRLTQLFMEADVPDTLPPDTNPSSAEAVDDPSPDDGEAAGDGESSSDASGAETPDKDSTSSGGQSGRDPSDGGPDGDAASQPDDPAQDGAGEGTGPVSAEASAGDTDQAGPASPGVGRKVDKSLPSQARGDLFEDVCEAVGEGARKDVPVIGASNVASGPVVAIDVTADYRRSAPLGQRLIPTLAPMIVGECWDETRSKSGRKFCAERLSRVRTDTDPSVFRKRIVEDDHSVAFHVLVDRSSSTKGCLGHIREATLALVSALEAFPQVATAISHFPTHGARDGGAAATFLTKPFVKPLRQTLGHWPQADGGTPLAEALQEVALSFALVEQTRRIVVIVTDGKPSNPDMVRKARETCHHLGVEVIGLVVKCDTYPVDLFDDSTKINEVADLAPALHALVLRNI